MAIIKQISESWGGGAVRNSYIQVAARHYRRSTHITFFEFFLVLLSLVSIQSDSLWKVDILPAYDDVHTENNNCLHWMRIWRP